MPRQSALLVQRSWEAFWGGAPEADALELGLKIYVGNEENAVDCPSSSHSSFFLAAVVLFVYLPSRSGRLSLVSFRPLLFGSSLTCSPKYDVVQCRWDGCFLACSPGIIVGFVHFCRLQGVY